MRDHVNLRGSGISLDSLYESPDFCEICFRVVLVDRQSWIGRSPCSRIRLGGFVSLGEKIVNRGRPSGESGAIPERAVRIAMNENDRLIDHSVGIVLFTAIASSRHIVSREVVA